VKNNIFAAIDIGTNTFRLLIAKLYYNPDIKNYRIEQICSERIITRIGQGIIKNKFIEKEAMERGISALKKFMDIINNHNVHSTAAVATRALRDARNSNEFIHEAHARTGVDIEIIDGDVEARKTASGMLIGLKVPDTALMIDIGGGSTELIFSKKGKPLSVFSIDLGVVYLAEKYMKNDPPFENDIRQMTHEISDIATPALNSLKRHFSRDTMMIGTAGTVTTLSAISQNLREFDHYKIHGSKVTLKQVKKIFSDIATIKSSKRARYIPFEPARLDIIVPGTRILLTIMEETSFDNILVSNHGLREGVLLELYNKYKKEC
jgi:exopolyphosphatase/guanosine-5'-triphosphate,3'-diphosphate pyrophosphatase